jgi:hypothetical protein
MLMNSFFGVTLSLVSREMTTFHVGLAGTKSRVQGCKGRAMTADW